MAFLLIKHDNNFVNGAVSVYNMPHSFISGKTYKVRFGLKQGSIASLPFTIKLDSTLHHSTPNIDLTGFTNDFKFVEYTCTPGAARANLEIAFTGGNNAVISLVELYQDLTQPELDAIALEEAAELEAKKIAEKEELVQEIYILIGILGDESVTTALGVPTSALTIDDLEMQKAVYLGAIELKNS